MVRHMWFMHRVELKQARLPKCVSKFVALAKAGVGPVEDTFYTKQKNLLLRGSGEPCTAAHFHAYLVFMGLAAEAFSFRFPRCNSSELLESLSAARPDGELV